MARKRIGELLVERGALTPAQLEQGLERHRQTRQRLGVALLGMGLLSEAQLVQVLSEALAIPVVELAGVAPEWTAVHMLRARFCEGHDLFPYALETIAGKKALCVAMSDPLNQPALDEIEFTTGLKVSPRLAPLSQIRAAILRYYHKVAAAEPGLPGPGGVGAGSAPVAVPARPPAPAAVDEAAVDDVIVGEELAPEPERPAPPVLLPVAPVPARGKPAPAPAAAKKAPSPVQSLSTDLDYLLGVRDQPEPVESLERKFWALLRLMQKKGLISNEEFTRELDAEDEG